jgi:hypothetical protein
LATSEGSLLENTQLLDSLNQSKESAEMAEKSLANLEKVRQEIDQVRTLLSINIYLIILAKTTLYAFLRTLQSSLFCVQ